MDGDNVKVFRLDGDIVEVISIYDSEIGDYVFDYPDFEENPRFTKSGKRWVNVISVSCPYKDDEYGDCGSCKFFKCEKAGDLIGICMNKKREINPELKG